MKPSRATGLSRLLPFLACALLLQLAPLRAITFFGTENPAFHTTAPDGAFQGSGWQWQVAGGVCATAIGPHHLATARHLGFNPGLEFFFEGLRYRVVRVSWADTGDLAMLEIAGRLGSFAPLYRGTNEVGKTIVMHGRGTQRGEPVYGPPPNGTQVRGWRWGGSDFLLRWGTNRVEETYDAKPEDGVTGSYLVSYFSNRGGSDLATFSVGDSGGGTFLRDTDGAWKLAGVNYGVEAQFNSSTNGAGFYATLFDRRGFYEFDDAIQAWTIDPEQAHESRTALYMTRVSSNLAWIDSQLERDPAVDWPILESSAEAAGPFTEHDAYAVTVDLKQIVINAGSQRAFFRLRSNTTLRLKGPTLKDGQFVFTYE